MVVELKITELKNVPICLHGILTYNVENVMAACAALIGIEIDYCMINKGDLERVNLENLADGIFHHIAKLTELDEANPDTQINTGTNQKNQHDRSPDEIVNSDQNI